MIKSISAITKYKNGISKLRATDKLSIKSIILPDVHESDDSTINFTKRVGGEMIQCYSLSEVKLKQPDICVPTFKEVIFTPCRASSIWVDIPCEPSIFDFEVELSKDFDFSFTTRNTTILPEYDYETGTYIPGEFPTTPLTLSLTLKDIEGFWSLKRNNELLYSSEQMPPLDTNKEIYEGGDFVYDIKFSLDIGEGSVGAVNVYEFRGKVSELGILTRNNAVATGELEITRYDSINISKYKFTTINVDLILPDYFPNHITTAKHMFFNSSIKGSSLSSWDVSNVMNMSGMFSEVNFKNNVDLSSWVTTKVIDMSSMFQGAFNFNKDISGWDVSNVTNMEYMFSSAIAFNQDLSQWCVELIPTLPYSFDTNTPNWTLPKPVWGECPSGDTVENNSNLIFSVESYNNPTNSYPLYVYLDETQGDWEIKESGVVVADSSGFSAEWVNLELDGYGGADIYFDINTPDIKQFETDVTASYVGIYYNGDNAEYEESPLGEVVIKQFSSKIPEFSTQLFSTLLQVPQTIPPELVDINRLFIHAYLFNQDISMWDVGNVVNMDMMFYKAKSFNQDLSQWCVNNIPAKPDDFDSDTPQWTLPKPIWGVCPSMPAPSPEDFGVLQPLAFTVSSTGEEFVPGYITAYVSGDNTKWELRESGVVVAKTGYRTISVEIIAETIDNKNIRIFVNPGELKHYALYASAPTLGLAVDSSDSPLGIADVTVTSFGTGAPEVKFDMGYSTLRVPNVLPTNITSCSWMFKGSKRIESDITGWSMSHVTNTEFMFSDANNFNQDISGWDTSNVVLMNNMFNGASTFNQDISGWDTSKVTNMWAMFSGASVFNQDLSQWCVELIPEEPRYFRNNTNNWSLSQPVWGTCPSGDTGGGDAEDTGLRADYPGTGWYKATDTGTVFNKGVPEGETHVFIDSPKEYVSVYTMADAKLYGERAAVSNITDMSFMFYDTPAFNQDVSSWDVSNVTNMLGILINTSLNPDISMWDTSSVTNMRAMFEGATAFNQDISNWNTSSVTDMGNMFFGASSFNQDLSGWFVTNIPTKPDGFDYLAESWTLPRPVWGTDGEAVIEEVLPTSLHFSSHNSKVGTHGLIIDLYLNKDALDSEWQVFESGKLIASNDKPYREGVTYNALGSWSPPTAVGITIELAGKDHEYEVRGALKSINISNWDTTTLEDTVTVHQFPTRDTEISMSVTDALLTVPDSIPSTYTSANGMFMDCYNFNQDISGWDMSNVTDTVLMFYNTSSFNQPIGSWNVSSVTNMASMFKSATSFNQDISSWDTSNVEDMNYMFYDASAFNSVISNWNVSSVTDMSYMFGEASSFNSDISTWDVSLVTDMQYMFFTAGVFNQDLSSWNVSNVTNMEAMFADALSFNQDISSWDVGSVTTMEFMFENATSFNKDLSSWNVSNVTNMGEMFDGASSFNQDLSSWCVSLIPTKPSNFDTEAIKWTLPKPVWGTDGTAGTPDPEGTPLRYNLISRTENTPISINMTPSSESYWVVYEGDVVIASSTGILASEYSLTSLEGVITLSRYFPLEYTAEFRVFGSFDTVNILHKNINSTYCEFNLLDFGSEILHHEFNIQYSTVTVPSTIPNYVTSLRRMFKGCNEFDQNLSGWDTINITNMSQVFEDAAGFNFNLLAWDTSSVTTMSGMFKNATAFDGDISSWDTSKVTDMSYMFAGAINFNKPLTNWNTTSLIDASYMFYNSTYFDQPISLWDVSKVVNMSHMFNLATNFDQDISEWRTIEVVDMSSMFAEVSYFNQDLSGWCVSKMESKPVDFDTGTNYWTKFKPRWGTCPPIIPDLQEPITADILKFELLNDDTVSPLTLQFDLKGPSGIWAVRENGKVIANSQGYVGHNNEREVNVEGYLLSTTVVQGESNLYEVIGSFDIVKLMYPPNTVISSTASITEFGEFIGKHLFNLHTTNLTVPSILPPHVTTTEEMFKGANYFDQDISTWDTTNVTSMASMFAGCLSFGKPLSAWNTSNVTDMSYMFHHCAYFISSLANWNTSNVTNMRGMFINTNSYNQPMNTWDTSKVTDMAYMFQGCSSFNQDIYLWDTAQVTDMSYMFSGCTTFNRGITNLDVSNVTNMQGMFLDADAFNKPLNTWNVSKVKDMRYMFDSADYFNQDLSMWDVTNIPRIPENFDNNSFSWIKSRPVWGTTPVPIEATSPVVSSTLYFKTTNNKSVEKELSTKIEIPSSSSSWTLRDVSTGEIVSTQAGSQMVGVTNSPIVSSTITVLLERDGAAIRNYSLEGIFTKVGIRHDTVVGVDLTVPDGSIKLENFSESVAWFVFRLTNVLLEVPTTLPTHIKNLSSMFSYSTLFNQDISMWNTSNVTNMSSMFRNCTSFNQDISSWDTSKVTTMASMFQTCKVFNQPIGSWNTAKVTTMTSMFSAAPAFNQDLSFWCLPNISSLPTTFDSGTTSWLPEKKPRWGTCYRGEFLTEVKTAVQPELGVEPLETVYIETDTFKFTTKSLLESVSVKTLTILTPPTVNLWSLKENGKLIADHTGFSSKGISNEISVLKYNTITIPINLIGTRDFEFVGGGEFIELIYSDAEAIKQIPSLSLTVDSFSSTLQGFRFNLPNVELTVPEALPQTITNLSHMFAGCNLFNQDISMWNTSNIIRMDNTFKDCYNFNQPISYWNTSKVTTMENMFLNCTNFNQYLNLWDSSKVRTIKGMFENCVQFNSPLNAWVLTSLGIVSSVFKNAVSFNQPLNNWNVSKVSMFDSMFEGAIKFNQDISTWNLKSALNLDSMFKEAHRFNQDLSNWCVGLIVTKPLNFDINAVSWFLPNPIWGTCPRNENLVLPPTQGEEEGLVPNLDRGPKPIMDMEAIQTSLMFSTKHQKITNKEMPLTITLNGVIGEWSLKTDGVVVADSQGTVSNLTRTTVTGDKVVLALAGNITGTVEYELNVKCSRLLMYYKTTPNITERLVGEVNLKTFSSNIDNYNFTLPYIDLKVPNALPANVLSTRLMFSECDRFNSNISAWDVSNVTTMEGMFDGCNNFSGDLSWWDVSSVTSMLNMFRNCFTFNSNLSWWFTPNVTNMSNMFFNCFVYNKPMNNWDVSNVTNTTFMFGNCRNFDQPLNRWNVSKINLMTNMFNGCSNYNQDLSYWCTTLVGAYPTSFNSNVTSWVEPIPIWGKCMRREDIPAMNPSGEAVRVPNPPLGTVVDSPTFNFTTINTSDTIPGEYPIDIVLTTDGTAWTLTEDSVVIAKSTGTPAEGISVVKAATPANTWTIKAQRPDLKERRYVLDSKGGSIKLITTANSNVGSVVVTEFSNKVPIQQFSLPDTTLIVPEGLPPNIINLSDMFSGCTLFNQNINMWDTSNVTNMLRMFQNCVVYNQPLSAWDTSKVTNMSYMFDRCTVFNQYIGNWNVSNVTNLSYMFNSCRNFDSYIGDWNTSKVTSIRAMFNLTMYFNQDISKWDMFKVTSMIGTFNGARSFNQDLSSWCVSKITATPTTFDTKVGVWNKPRPIWGTCPERPPTPS